MSPVAIADTMAQSLAGMASTGSPRQPMDRSAMRDMVNASAEYVGGTTLRPRAHALATDPAYFPVSTPNNVLKEPGGARFGLRVRMPVPVSMEASATQANGRIVRGRGTRGSVAGGASA